MPIKVYDVTYSEEKTGETFKIQIPVDVFHSLVEKRTTSRYLLLILWRRVQKVNKLYLIYSIAVILWFINRVQA